MTPTQAIELMKKGIEAASDLDVKMCAISLYHEVERLEEKVKALTQERDTLQRRLTNRKNLVYKDKAYYLSEESGIYEKDPICDFCYIEKNTITCIANSDGVPMCSNCKKVFDGAITPIDHQGGMKVYF